MRLALMTFAVITVTAILCYLLYVIVSSRSIVRHMDRSAYALCDKHGAIRAADMLTIYEDPETGHKIEKCPLCFTEQKNVAAEQLAILERRRDTIAAGEKTTK